MAGMLTEAASRVPGLTPYERAVLVCLADHMNMTNKRCFPSVPTIAKETCMSVRQVHRELTKLQNKGLIEIIGKYGKSQSNMYALHLNTPYAKQSGVIAAGVPNSQSTPATQSGPPCHTVTTPLTLSHPNKVIEQGQEQGKENKKTSSKLLTPAGETQKQGNQEDDVEIENLEIGGKQEAEQALPEGEAPPPVPLLPLPVTKDSKIVALWKAEIGKLNQANIVTKGEAKMLMEISKNVGYENMLMVIPLTIAKWADFISHCESYAGAFNSPKQPSVPHFYKHQAKAFDFCKSKIEAYMYSNTIFVNAPDCLKHLKKSPTQKPINLQEPKSVNW